LRVQQCLCERLAALTPGTSALGGLPEVLHGHRQRHTVPSAQEIGEHDRKWPNECHLVGKVRGALLTSKVSPYFKPAQGQPCRKRVTLPAVEVARLHKESRYKLRESSRALTCAQFYALRSATSCTRLNSVAVYLRPGAVVEVDCTVAKTPLV
jgi:hypothetical protein